MLVYDIEIVKAICKEGEERLDGIEYCDGFHDVENCGISVICAHDWITERYRVFTKESFKEFEALAKDRVVVGFNSIAFDDMVCQANGIDVKTDWDLLLECWIADGLGPKFEYPSHAGYGLGALAVANGLTDKTGHGALAPVDWQRGLYGSVIDYCLEDVRLTSKMVEQVGHFQDKDAGLCIMSPKTGECFRKEIRLPPYDFLPW